MKKKFKIFIKWPNEIKKIFFICFCLAVFFKLLKRIASLNRLLATSKKVIPFQRSSFSKNKIFEVNHMIEKISKNFIDISCLTKVLIIKKYFADSEILEINIGTRMKNSSFESHAWINHEYYLQLEDVELITFKKLHEFR
tara:strand:- start:122 stop:541 length:420 start_codon:yes stop_codon:yes gene_type:complete